MTDNLIDEIQSTEKQQEETQQQEEKQAVETAVNEGMPEVDFGKMLEQYDQDQTSFRRGQIVTGKVVGFTENSMMVDFGHKSEGMVDISEVKTPEGELKVKEGDEIEVVIRNIDSSDNPPVLSYAEAVQRRAWEKITAAAKNKETIKCKVIQRIKGGLKVDVYGVEAFLPTSQIDSQPVRNPEKFVGEELEVKILRYSRKKNNVVVSRKVITDEIIKKQKEEFFSQIKEGYVVEGTIKRLTDYGAFIDIGGVDGLLHITEMSWEKIDNPAALFKVGDKIQVKILKINRKKEKISLGYKQLLPNPWDIVPETYQVGTVVKGKVVSLTDYGAFVELEPGVEGLVHISEMTWSKRKKHPKKIVSVGQEINAQVTAIAPKEKRISLSMKNLMPDPWEAVEEKYPVGTRVKAVVRKLTEFGAFVEIDDAIEGLVHISEISWKKIKHPKEVLNLKKKQEIEAEVIRIDHNKKRLALSMKALQPSAWELFTKEHHTGDIVRGKITRFANFGVFVQLAEDLEGLCHISELSEEKVDSPDKVVKIGDELEFRILQIDHANQRIRLSHRAVKAKEDEEERQLTDKKIFIATEAKGGIASLGELLNIKLGQKVEKLIPKKKEETSSEAEEKTAEQKEEQKTETAEEAKAGETKVEEQAEEQKSETSESSSATAETQASSESETATQQEAKVEAHPESKGEIQQESNVNAEAQQEATTEVTEKVEAQQETVEETAKESEAEQKSSADSEAQAESKTEAESETQAEPEAEAKSESEAQQESDSAESEKKSSESEEEKK